MISDPAKSSGEGPKRTRSKSASQSESKVEKRTKDSLIETIITEAGEGVNVLFRNLKESKPLVNLEGTSVDKTGKRSIRKPRETKKQSSSRLKTKATFGNRSVAKKDALVKQNFEKFAVPEGAPRIAIVNGRSCLYLDGKVVPPFFFFGNPRNEKASEIILNEIRKAGAAGVHLHCLMIDFRVDEEGAQDALDLSVYLLKEVIEADPQAKVLFRIVFAGGESWEQQYPCAVYRHEDGTLAEPSFFDDAFWNDAKRYLRDWVTFRSRRVVFC
jgi:hypothetical protein